MKTTFQVITITLASVLFLALCVTVLKYANLRIEAKCIEKGGQVIASPGRYSSCLYPTK